MPHRINERNAGHTTIDGNLKARSEKGVTLKGDSRQVTSGILQKVYEAMQKDDAVGGDFTDGGRITLMLDRYEMAILMETIQKLNPNG